MARKDNAAAAKKTPQNVEDGTADAAAGALGFALHAVNEKGAAHTAGAVNELAALCDRAADHMALAHNLIAAHESHTETAIGHLDAALDCLKQIAEEGGHPGGAETSGKSAGSAKGAKTAKKTGRGAKSALPS